MPILLQLQKLPWKGDGGWKKSLCVVFWLTRRSRVHRKNAFWGILKHEQQVIAYLQTHYDYGPQLKNAFNVGSIKFANSLSPPGLPLWRKYAPEVKAAKGLKRCRAKVKGVNNPAWIAQYHHHHSHTPPHGKIWVPWQSEYTVQVVCKWAVAACVCGAGFNKCITLSFSNSFVMTKRPFPNLFIYYGNIFFYYRNSLIFCYVPILY